MTADLRPPPIASSLGRRLVNRALVAARQSLGHIGLLPVDGAALSNPGERTIRTARADATGTWAGRDLLTTARPGAAMAVVRPPDAERLAAIRGSGVERLWVAGADPSGDLRDEDGLTTTVVDDPRAAALGAIRAHAVSTGRAFVVMKVASSADGRIATRGGQSQWITGPAARAAGRRIRGVLDAILVGVDTVIADDPQLTSRRRGVRDPVRVVLDSRLRTPPDARVVSTATSVRTVILTTDQAPAAARELLQRQGVEVVTQPTDGQGRVSVTAVTKWLVGQSLPGLLIEGGGAVHGAFVDAGLVDRLVWFGAPVLIGGEGRPAVGGRGPHDLADALRFERWSVRRIGRDWMIDLVR